MLNADIAIPDSGAMVLMWKMFDTGSAAYQFGERHDWIPSLGVQYRVGVDGLGLLMVLLTAIVTPMALLASLKTLTAPELVASTVL